MAQMVEGYIKLVPMKTVVIAKVPNKELLKAVPCIQNLKSIVLVFKI